MHRPSANAREKFSVGRSFVQGLDSRVRFKRIFGYQHRLRPRRYQFEQCRDISGQALGHRRRRLPQGYRTQRALRLMVVQSQAA